jgi:hypothetical protein
MNNVNMKDLVKYAPKGALSWTPQSDSYYPAYYDGNGMMWTTGCGFEGNWVKDDGFSKHGLITLDFNEEDMNIDDIAKEDKPIFCPKISAEFDRAVKSFGDSPKPVFTQAMRESGKLPSVGSIVDIEFVFSETYRQVEITYMGNGVGCYKASNGNEFTFSTDSVRFHVIDTRTDEEKLIDEIGTKLLSFHSGDMPSFNDQAKSLLDEYNITRKDADSEQREDSN